MKTKALALLLMLTMLVSGVALAAEPLTDVYGLGTYPLTEEKIELSAFATRVTPSHIWDIETNWTTTFMESVTNVHINWDLIIGDNTEQAQKLNLMLIGGEYPDILLSTPITRAQLMEYGEAGVLIPLNDLIAEHAPNFQKAAAETPGLMEAITAPDGNIYGLPSISAAYHTLAPKKMWSFAPWYEALGVEIPANTQELYDTLVAFRDRDPNGNGVKDEIPLASNSMGAIYNYIMNAFVYYDGTYTEVNDGVISFNANTEAFREGLRYLHKLYTEGLIIQNIYTMDATQLKALTMADVPVVGMVPGLWIGGFVSSALAAEEGSRFWEYSAALPALEGPDGMLQTAYANPDYVGNVFSITKNCEHPEIAMRWADFIYNIYNDMNVHYAPQWADEEALSAAGYGWRMAQEGELGNDGSPAIWRYIGFQSDNNAGYGCKVVPSYQPTYMHSGQVSGNAATNYESLLWNVTNDLYMPYAVDKSVTNLFMSSDAASIIAEHQTILNAYVAENMALFVTGDKSLDTDWDAYVSGLEGYGLSEYIDLYQQQLDAAK